MTSLAVGFGLGFFVGVLISAVRGRFGPRLLTTVDVVAGAGLLGFACLLGWRAVHES